MTLSHRVTTLTLTLVLAFAATASAQFARGMRKEQPVQPATIDDPNAWGTSAPTVVTLTSLDFVPFDGTFAPLNEDTGAASCATGFCFWVATLRVPSGVSIRAFELSACDGDAAVEIQAGLAAGPKVPGNAFDISPFVATGVPATPGCSSFNFVLPTPVTVDNNNFFYAVQVGAEAGTNVNWNQVRVRYRLQVSPAPGTATFTDVPVGHPQRQFIEALVGAGITGGCGGSNYCPDSPVTRGQMAVFLAAALGLHWPF